jgi:diguanylate cyclase (GGDEF)-like protein
MKDDTDREHGSGTATRREADTPRAPGAQDACLVVISGARLGARIVPGGDEIVIGRDVHTDFQIADRGVSRRHCRIMADDEGYWIEDLDSTNQTFVNDRPVDRAPLRDGDHVRVSSTTLKFIGAGNIEADYHSELHESTIRDPLTGLFNRRHAMAVLDTESARARRDREYRLALALLDIDFFKPINDEHGHLAGDQVLKQLGRIASARTRGGDTLARIGGEEFALILPGTGRDEAWQLADALRGQVRDETFDTGDVALRITLSGGVAEWDGEMRRAEDLLQRADEALYAAKNGGRDRIGQAPPVNPSTSR